MRWGIDGAGAVTMCLLTCYSLSIAAESPWQKDLPLHDAAILFDSNRAGTTEIYTIGSNGSGPQRITSSPSGIFNRLPDWSPDCSKIAFQSNREARDNRDIYVMAADGSRVRRITTHEASDESPAWSPDGSRIAFASDRGDGEAIWVVGVDGTGLQRIASGSSPAFQPAWSPDGRHIAFITGSDDNWDLFVARSDGSEIRNLTITPDRHEGGPAWSPDGREIAFDALRDGHWEIYLVHADGSNERRLTHNMSMDARPGWSPDGNEIVFHSTRAFGTDGDIKNWSEVELYVVRNDGKNARRLTNNQHFDAHPDWCSVR